MMRDAGNGCAREPAINIDHVHFNLCTIGFCNELSVTVALLVCNVFIKWDRAFPVLVLYLFV